MSVKGHFTSRFKDGKLIQADLSQIEVIIAAQLSGDPTLIQLIREGRDVHKFMVSNIYGEPENSISKDDPRRKAAKPGTFGILYGNGATRLSENTGMSVEWCKEFIETFYKLFPRIKLWHNFLQEQVEINGQLTLVTGQILKFEKYPAKFEWQIKKGIMESYNPPDIKNHPVQSTAQVIMACWIGNFFRVFGQHKREKYLMVNEIHDSLILECRSEYVDEVVKDLKESLDFINSCVYNDLGIKFVVPIRGEIAIGKSWAEI